MGRAQVSDEPGAGSTGTSSGTNADFPPAPAASACNGHAADPELGTQSAAGLENGSGGDINGNSGDLNGGGGGGEVHAAVFEGVNVGAGSGSADSEVQGEGRGMVLPFQPMTVTFRDVHYYVPSEV